MALGYEVANVRVEGKRTVTSSKRDYGTMVFITYTLRPGSEADGYDDWLREIDNPPFNKTPGIAHYANWKVKENRGAELPYTHFDLIGIEGPESLEQVWFDEPLDEFRKGWVEKWGSFSVANPSKANTLGALSERIGAASGPRSGHVIFVGGPANAVSEDAGYDTWRIDKMVRKHWAVGRAKPGEPWRTPLSPENNIGFSYIQLKYVDGPRAFPPPPGSISGDPPVVFLGELIASPD